MYRSLKRIWAVALLTSTEGLRQPAFFVLFVAAAALTALAPSFAYFHLGEEAKMVTDLGLSTALTFSTLLVLLTASSTITDEIEGRTALTMLSKPLRREEFLIGKYIGIALTGCAMLALLSVVLLATFRSQKYDSSQEDPRTFMAGVLGGALITVVLFAIFAIRKLLFSRGGSLVLGFWVAYVIGSVFMLGYLSHSASQNVVWEWRLLFGMFFIALHTCVIAAVAVALATRLTLVQSAIGTAAFFVVGHASGALVAPFRNENNELSLIGAAFRAILPDLDQFNITDALATAYVDKPIQIPWDIVGSSSVYALLYGVALLALGAALFSRRELG